ncbi:ABC transporter substrate-binding protein [Kineosporia babensis]|uniref:Extracellular solute-binding protein n=1 Tax=Kineosporia babensis TaxID=499548 RepID=A0A9X1NLL5_9ACTN|nr:extracellular solute-binding protein [Kineosporia babensis]MCD5316590.1 extracellular solute-binding protein [Kineosporia babensis]
MSTRFSRRVLFGGAIAAASAVVLAGCGVGEETADVALSNEEVTLRFSWWGSDSRHELTNQLIDAFEKENPKIKVKGEFSDWVGYWDRMATTFAANDAPDIVQMDELYLRTYADRNSLLDLGKTTEFLNTDGFSDVSLAAGQAGGTQYALPIGNGSLSVVANKTVLDELKIDLPDDKTWTWDDYAKISAEISEKSGGKVVGSGIVGSEASLISIYARQQGGSLFDDNGKVTLKPEQLTPLWQMNKDMAGKGMPSAEATAEQMSAPLNQTWLVLGKQAFNFNYNTQITSLQAAAPDQEFVLLQMPQSAGSDQTGFYYKPSMYWAISARTEHPAEAAKFLDFLANSETAAKIQGTDRGIPANEDSLAAIRPDLDPSSELAAKFNDQVKDLVQDPPALTPAGASDINAMIQRQAQEVLFDRATPEEASTKFIEELTAAVDAAAS